MFVTPTKREQSQTAERNKLTLKQMLPVVLFHDTMRETHQMLTLTPVTLASFLITTQRANAATRRFRNKSSNSLIRFNKPDKVLPRRVPSCDKPAAPGTQSPG